MGLEFYLVRDDKRELYDLGKFTGDWGAVLGETRPRELFVVRADVAEIVSLLEQEGGFAGAPAGYLQNVAAQRGDLDEVYDGSLHCGPDVADETLAYWHAVVVDVVDWSEGQLFEFHSEHSGLYEEIMMNGYNHDPPCERLFRTGDRHDSFATRADGSVVSRNRAYRDDLARRRQSDSTFRCGRVWIDRRSRLEFVLNQGAERR